LNISIEAPTTAGGSEVRARTLAQHVDNLLAAGGETAYRAAEGFAQRTGQDIDLSAQVVEFGDTATGLAQHACRVALIDHHQRIVFLGQLADLIQRSGVAVHREDAVGYDDAETLCLGFLEAILQLGHVGVGVTVANGLAQTHAVDDRRVVERIGDDRILLGKQRLEHAAVGVEASGIENRILGTEIVGDRLLELLVHILATADETHGRHAVAACVHRLLRRFDQTRIVRKAEVVVRTEIQHLTSADRDLGTLRGFDDAFVLVEPCRFDFGQLMLQMFFNFTVHIVRFCDVRGVFYYQTISKDSCFL